MTPYDPQRHHRHSIRLQGYDYTQSGAYFVTICTHGRALLFGNVVGGEMRLNDAGRIVRDEWFKTAQLRPYVVLYEDEFVVMPNHIHGIIEIVGANHYSPNGTRTRANDYSPLLQHQKFAPQKRCPACVQCFPCVGK